RCALYASWVRAPSSTTTGSFPLRWRRSWHSVAIERRTFPGPSMSAAMSNMTTVEAKAFVPSSDFALSKRFSQDLGFDLAWSSEDLACFRQGNASFLLQNFYVSEHADNFM